MDLTMTLGDVITAAAVLAGGLTAYGGMRATINALGKSLIDLSVRTEAQFEDVKIELKKLGDVMVMLAENKGRMERIDDRAIMQGGRIDENTKQINTLKDDVNKLMIQLAGLRQSI